MIRSRHFFQAIVKTASFLGVLVAGAAVADISVPVKTETPASHFIQASSLPAPYATRSVDNFPHLVARPAGAALHVPPGFSIAEWATGLENPRFITVAPNGDVFVAESAPGIILVLRPAANGAMPSLRREFLTGLRQPFGIAFYPVGLDPKYIYVADTDAVLRYPYHNGDLKAGGPGKLLIHLPGGGYNQHWTRTIVFSPNGKKLFVSVGSRENVGIEPPPRACVMVYTSDGTQGHVFASGLRNAVGLGFSPVTGALWAGVNERDDLGDNVPPDYVTSVRAGGFYGWPYYYIGGHHDPRMPLRPDLASKTIVPDVLLAPHCAALSISFGQKSSFPRAYKSSIYVATHGSWNRSTRSGYEVMRVPMNANGTAQGGYKDFAWGWCMPDGTVWGRPVCTAFARDGSLLITDDGGNKIWRVADKK